VSHPDDVVKLIEAAAEAVSSGATGDHRAAAERSVY
jgi:hypothetical protein